MSKPELIVSWKYSNNVCYSRNGLDFGNSCLSNYKQFGDVLQSWWALLGKYYAIFSVELFAFGHRQSAFLSSSLDFFASKHAYII